MALINFKRTFFRLDQRVCLIRWMSTPFRPKVVLDQQLKEQLTDSSLNAKARRHPGIVHLKTVRLPDSFYDAVNKVVTDRSLKDLTRRASELNNHLVFKKPPLTDEDLEQVRAAVNRKVVQKFSGRGEPFESSIRFRFTHQPVLIPLSADVDGLTSEEQKSLNDAMREESRKQFQKTAYKWRSVVYNPENAMLYLVARAAPDYASVLRVLSEISSRDPDFQPHSLFDFGSGVGTVLWYKHAAGLY